MVNEPPDRKKRFCVMPTCKGKRFDLVHKFPMGDRAELWREIINVPELYVIPIDQVRKKFFICSHHFAKADYKNIESRSLNKTALPTLNLSDIDNIEVDSSATLSSVVEHRATASSIPSVVVDPISLGVTQNNVQCRLISIQPQNHLTKSSNAAVSVSDYEFESIITVDKYVEPHFESLNVIDLATSSIEKVPSFNETTVEILDYTSLETVDLTAANVEDENQLSKLNAELQNDEDQIEVLDDETLQNLDLQLESLESTSLPQKPIDSPCISKILEFPIS